MAIYYCPHCNKKYFLDDMTLNSEEFQNEFRCNFCGSEYVKNQNNAVKTGVNTFQMNSNNDNKNERNTGTNQHTQSNKLNNTSEMDLLLQIERKQLDALESIRSMVMFFTVLTCISIALAIISFLI